MPKPATTTEQPADGRQFDFTAPVEAMDAATQNVYYRLRRVALLNNDADALPDGKTYSETQVIEILGEDYATGLVINTKCCA